MKTTIRPQKMENVKIGATGETQDAKKAIDVVAVVRNIADAASGKATEATNSVGEFLPNRSFTSLNLSQATKRSSAPKAAETKNPIKLSNEKNLSPKINL